VVPFGTYEPGTLLTLRPGRRLRALGLRRPIEANPLGPCGEDRNVRNVLDVVDVGSAWNPLAGKGDGVAGRLERPIGLRGREAPVVMSDRKGKRLDFV
jgi:hypothetical protein